MSDSTETNMRLVGPISLYPFHRKPDLPSEERCIFAKAALFLRPFATATCICFCFLQPEQGPGSKSGRPAPAARYGDPGENTKRATLFGRNRKKTAFESVNVMPQVAGRITERHFQDGDNLRRGQLLFVIDPSPFKAQLDSAKANLAQAEAALELAKVQFARDQELVGTRAISKQDYDTKKSTVDQSAAQVEAAKAAIETAQINLDYCYIHSSDRRARWRATRRCWKCCAGQHYFASLNSAS